MRYSRRWSVAARAPPFLAGIEIGGDAGGGHRTRLAAVAHVEDQARIPKRMPTEGGGRRAAAPQIAFDPAQQMHVRLISPRSCSFYVTVRRRIQLFLGKILYICKKKTEKRT